ncbi:MAG: 50S ribosomal protein L5 [Chloroflexi bacterium]|nr:50S ribosomal protein L5 [Chloroflexota bacterium]
MAQAPAARPSEPRLRARYRQEAAPELTREFGYTNAMSVPTLSRIVVNVGLGEALTNARAVETATSDLMTITGQRPIVTRAKRAISNFRLRAGNPVGLKVTLRGSRMWEFFDRLVNAGLPRTRDFRGVPIEAFDGRGNYSLGISEQVIFPEIDFAAIDRVRGMQVNIVTTARTDEEGRRLLSLLGMPFARRD